MAGEVRVSLWRSLCTWVFFYYFFIFESMKCLSPTFFVYAAVVFHMSLLAAPYDFAALLLLYFALCYR